MQYYRFLLFDFEEDDIELRFGKHKKSKKGLISQEIAETLSFYDFKHSMRSIKYKKKGR